MGHLSKHSTLWEIKTDRERSLLRKTKNETNATLQSPTVQNKQASGRGRKACNTAILKTLQLLPSARTKANACFPTERKTNRALLQRCNSPRKEDEWAESLAKQPFREAVQLLPKGRKY